MCECLQSFFVPRLLWIRSFVVGIPLLRHLERNRLLHPIGISVFTSKSLSAVVPASILGDVSITHPRAIKFMDWKVSVAFTLLFHKLLWLILLYFLIRLWKLIDLGLRDDSAVLCRCRVSFKLGLTDSIQGVRRGKRVSLCLIMLHLVSEPQNRIDFELLRIVLLHAYKQCRLCGACRLRRVLVPRLVVGWSLMGF